MFPKKKCQKVKKIDELIVISLGTLEFHGKSYFGKSAVIKYLHEMSTYFNKVYFICHVENKHGIYNTKLDVNKVEPVRISDNIGKNTILHQFVNLLKDNIKIAKLVTKRMAVIIISPMIWFTPIFPILSVKCGHLMGYIASNPEDVARLQSSGGGVSGTIKSKITLLFVKMSLILSDSLLVRGDIFRYQKYGASKVYESKPIISLSEKNPYSRNDTCNEENITILYVGGLYERKGIGVLMRAFSNLIKKINNKCINLKIVGGKEQHLERAISTLQKLNIYDKTQFLGWIDNDDRLADEYLSSDILVIPSLIAEGLPRVIDEGNYYCIPIIATDLGYGSSLEHKKNIFFIKPNSVEQLEKALEEIISNDKLRKRMIKHGKKRIKNILKACSAAKQHAKIIKSSLRVK